MDLSIFLAQAAAPGGDGIMGSIGSMLPMFAIIFGIFYFMIIRPQQKRLKAHQALLSGVKRGDKVVLTGGMHGSVHEVKDATVLVEVAKNVVVQMEKGSIQSVVKADEEA